MLALPGSAYLYQGEELGLAQVDVAPEVRQDPVWLRTGEPDGTAAGCPCRGAARAAVRLRPGTATAVDPAARRTGRASPSSGKMADRDSTLAFYRDVLAERRTLDLDGRRRSRWSDLGDDVVAFRRAGPLTVVLNCGEQPRPAARRRGHACERSALPGRLLPPDTAAWLRLTRADT